LHFKAAALSTPWHAACASFRETAIKEETMPSALVRALCERHGLPRIEPASLDAFLGDAPAHGLILFAGDPKARMETDDVAVVMPELLKAFRGRLRGGVIAPAAEEKLKARFHVVMTPSLVVVRGAETIDVIAKIRDWSEYVARIEAALRPDAAALAPSAGPKTQIRINGERVEA
jgi:hydrogenase-1 operon protein HyaE